MEQGKNFEKNMTARMPVVMLGVSICLLIIFKGGVLGFILLVSFICTIAAYELNHADENVINIVKIFSCIISGTLPLIIRYTNFTIIAVILTVFLIILTTLNVKKKPQNSITSVLVPIFASFIVPCLFVCLIKTRELAYGTRLVIIPFITSWCSDGGAHIIGSLFGKHKLCPKISPNKTVEGFFGGIFGSMLGMGVYGAVFCANHVTVQWVLFLILGITGAVFGTCGDLFSSYLKRLFGVKDFGKIMLGHGGILDRFDSVAFCSPIFLMIFENVCLWK